MFKSVATVKAALARLYDRLWAEEAAECSGNEWPQYVPLGKCSKLELEEHFVEACAAADELRAAAASMKLAVKSETRLVGGSKQNMPTHFVVEDMAALVNAIPRKREFANACSRTQRLKRDFPHNGPAELAQLLRKMQTAVPDDVDFDLACKAGRWFAENGVQGLTPRQVPLAGFHAKWLDKPGRSAVVARLAGLESLQLEQRPAQVRFTYLDPSHLRAGGRRFDSWVVGDAWTLPYEPKVVIICENRDTALWFPQLEDAIAVMGDGFAAIRNLPVLEWVRDAEFLVYWGDIDAAGLEILSGCRQAGLACTSIFMDMCSFEEYECFGTSVDKNGRAISPKEPDELSALQPNERELYLHLVDPSWTRPRRIEQERIPLEAALGEIRKLFLSREL